MYIKESPKSTVEDVVPPFMILAVYHRLSVDGDSFMYMRVIIPTLDICTVKCQVAETASSTYYDLDEVTTSQGTHNYATTFLLGGYRFVRLVASASQSTAAISIKCSGLGVY